MAEHDYVWFENTRVLGVTSKALHVVLEGVGEAWLPKSQVEDPERLAEGDTGITLGVSQWILDQKGIEV
jgi:hypothetical protein